MDNLRLKDFLDYRYLSALEMAPDGEHAVFKTGDLAGVYFCQVFNRGNNVGSAICGALICCGFFSAAGAEGNHHYGCEDE